MVYSPVAHRYGLAAEAMRTQAPTVLDVGGYQSRENILKNLVRISRFESANVGSAWYENESYTYQIEDNTIPVPDASFDVVTIVDALEHVDASDRLALLREGQRCAANELIVVVPFRSTDPTDERILLDLSESANIAPMPSLSEHELYGLPTEDELRGLSSQLDMTISFHTPRRLYWSAQMAMVLNQIVRGDGVESENRAIQRWMDECLSRDPITADVAYRAVLVKRK